MAQVVSRLEGISGYVDAAGRGFSLRTRASHKGVKTNAAHGEVLLLLLISYVEALDPDVLVMLSLECFCCGK